MDKENQRNFILAAVLSLAVVFLWQLFIISPRIEAERAAAEAEAQLQAQQQATTQTTTQTSSGDAGVPAAAPSAGNSVVPGANQDTTTAGGDAVARIAFKSDKLDGSINLKGARIDDLNLAHPDLGHDGGTLLHDKVRNAWTKIGDNMSSRYFTASAIANSTLTTFGHNFGIGIDEFSVFIFTGTYPNLTLVADPVGAGWVVAATPGMEKLEIDVTTPSSGGPHDFAVFVIQGGGGGGGLELEMVSSAITALPNKHYLVDTSGGAFTITLPMGQDGAVIRFTDITGDWGTDNLTVQGDGVEQIRLNDVNIDNELIADVPESWFQLMWDGTQWTSDTPFNPTSQDYLGETAVVDLATDPNAGAFTAGILTFERIGRRVTVTNTSGSITHGSASTATSGTLVPASMRPQTTIETVVNMNATRVASLRISNTGTVQADYLDWAGASVAQTSFGVNITATWLV